MNHLTPHQLQEYVDGMLTNEMEFHVRTCSECQLQVDAFRKVERTLRKFPLEKASPQFAERVMQQLGIKQSSSLTWMLFKNMAPLVALTFVAGILYAALRVAGVFQETELQQTTSLTQNVYNQLGGSLSSGVQAFNDWMAKYFSFAFAKNTYGLTAFVIGFFVVIGLLDKYILMPMMRKRM